MLRYVLTILVGLAACAQAPIPDAGELDAGQPNADVSGVPVLPPDIEELLARLQNPPQKRVSRIEYWGRVDDLSVMSVLAIMEATKADLPDVLVLDINSPSGEWEAGFRLAKSIEDYPRPVVCVADGSVASMAYYIMSACDVRLMTRRSSLLIHEPGYSSNRMLTRASLEEMLQDQNRLADRWAWFTQKKMRISMAEFRKKVLRRDWEMNADEALKVGAVDGLADDILGIMDRLRKGMDPADERYVEPEPKK